MVIIVSSRACKLLLRADTRDIPELEFRALSYVAEYCDNAFIVPLQLHLVIQYLGCSAMQARQAIQYLQSQGYVTRLDAHAREFYCLPQIDCFYRMNIHALVFGEAA